MKKQILFSIYLTLIIHSTPLFAEAWKKVFSENDIVVEAKNVEEGVIPFRASATIKAPLLVILNALKNAKTKPHWAPKLKSVKIHQQIHHDEYIFSEFYKTPWPAFDREFLLHGKILEVRKDQIKLTATSLKSTELINDDHVQADVKVLDVSLEKIEKNLTRVVFEFQGDLGGWIPVWLSNIIQKKWPYKFLLNLRNYINSDEKNLTKSH